MDRWTYAKANVAGRRVRPGARCSGVSVVPHCPARCAPWSELSEHEIRAVNGLTIPLGKPTYLAELAFGPCFVLGAVVLPRV